MAITKKSNKKKGASSDSASSSASSSSASSSAASSAPSSSSASASSNSSSDDRKSKRTSKSAKKDTKKPAPKGKVKETKGKKPKKTSFVMEQEYKGTATFGIFDGKEEDYEEGKPPIISFGLRKAEAIVAHLEELKEWVENQK